MHFAGIDAGTTEIKCIIFDDDGANVGIGRRSTTLSCPKPGQVEQDPNQLWGAVKEAVRSSIVASGISPNDIAAIGIGGQSGGTLMLDESGKALKLISWRDTRASTTVLRLKRAGVEKDFYQITGWPLWPEFASVQLAWLKENDRQLLSKTKTVYSCPDWVAYNLTKELKASASSLIGTIDSKTGRHSERLLKLCGIANMTDCFPAAIDASQVFGAVTQQAAQETDLVEGTPVVCAGYDMACSATGAGGVSNGRAVCVLGTSGTNMIVSNKPIRDKTRSVVSAYHMVPGLWLTISESMSAVPNLNWFIDQFCTEEKRLAASTSRSIFEVCDHSVQDVPPGAGGIIYHPYLTGETGPFTAPTATASFFGISQSHTVKHLLRAVYEGVGYSIRHNFAKLSSIGGGSTKFNSVVLVGGGSRSETWCQMIADILQRKTVRPSVLESGCVGAAMAAAVAVSAVRTFKEAASKFVRLNDEYMPNREQEKTYSEGFSQYSRLIDSYKPLWRH